MLSLSGVELRRALDDKRSVLDALAAIARFSGESEDVDVAKARLENWLTEHAWLREEESR